MTGSSSTSAAHRTGSRINPGRTPATRSASATAGSPRRPIAPAEVQGYAYDARIRAAELADHVWDDPDLAIRLRESAAALRDRFDEAFWVEDRGDVRARARRRQATRRLALLEPRPPALVGNRARESGRPGRRRSRRPGALDRLGRAHDGRGGGGVQPAQLPQRHRLAARHGARRLGSRARRLHRSRPAVQPQPDRGGGLPRLLACPRCSQATSASRQRFPSPIRPPPGPRRGPPERPCSASRCCSACVPDPTAGILATLDVPGARLARGDAARGRPSRRPRLVGGG